MRSETLFFCLILLLHRNALIAKSVLYDKLRNQELKATGDDQYLVNFGENELKDSIGSTEEDIDEDGDPDSEW